MKNVFPSISKWVAAPTPFAIATVIKTWGSSPRPVGSTMLISEDMEMAGSVSGGCVEGAVIKAALPLIEKGIGQQLEFGVTNEEAWQVGLSCGGKMQVYAERFLAFDKRKEEQAAWEKLKLCLKKNEPSVLLTQLIDGAGGHTIVLPNGETVGQPISDNLKKEALRAYKERKNQVIETKQTELSTPPISNTSIPNSYFAQVFPRKSQMLIIGAAHITVDLVKLANMYGFETVVIDPRGVFAKKTQFAIAPDQLIEKYPSEVLNDFNLDAYSYAVILSHDPKIDDNALHILLKSNIAYIGALGSRKTQAKRVARLQEAGFSEDEINKIHAPIGMDIKAKTPAEIALSVMGEIIKVKNEFL